MSAARCKLLMSNLPGIAAVVNAFQSPDVQMAVYQALISALDGRITDELSVKDGRKPAVREPPQPAAPGRIAGNGNGELAHDLEEGDSIHALVE